MLQNQQGLQQGLEKHFTTRQIAQIKMKQKSRFAQIRVCACTQTKDTLGKGETHVNKNKMTPEYLKSFRRSEKLFKGTELIGAPQTKLIYQ